MGARVLRRGQRVGFRVFDFLRGNGGEDRRIGGVTSDDEREREREREERCMGSMPWALLLFGVLTGRLT